MRNNNLLERKYNLTENPFTSTTASNKWLDTWTNRTQELEKWRKFIKASKKGQGNQIAFLIGEYGRGKTLSLLKIFYEASSEVDLMPIYLNFQGEQKVKKVGIDFLFRLLRGILEAIKDKHINRTKLAHALDKISDDLSEPKDVIKAILVDKEQENRKLAEYFISGQIQPNKKELRQLGIIRKIDDVEIAKEYLAALLILLWNIGYKGTFFAVDEFEYLFSLVPKSQRAIYIALLRGLYDFPVGMKSVDVQMAKLNFFIAISEGGWNSLKEMDTQERGQGGPVQPLMRRITLKSTLLPFSKLETRELIKNRLSYDRVRGTRSAKPLIPFSDDFVSFVFEKANGELWRTIFICSHVLDAGLEKGVSILNKVFAEKVMKERNI